MFVLEIDGAPAGLFQRYRIDDEPDWRRAISVATDARAAGIDYYLGEEALTGRGLGTQAVATFTAASLAHYPDVDAVIAAPQQANVASWRALEKAGFVRLWAGTLDSDDPGDAGPAYIYARWR